MHRYLAAGDAGLEQLPVVVMERKQLHAVGFEDEEIDGEPWAAPGALERLARLSDQRPYQLMVAEKENQPKRGW